MEEDKNDPVYQAGIIVGVTTSLAIAYANGIRIKALAEAINDLEPEVAKTHEELIAFHLEQK